MREKSSSNPTAKLVKIKSIWKWSLKRAHKTNSISLISVCSSRSLCAHYTVYDGCACARFGFRMHRTTTHKYTQLMHNENPFTSINFQINYNIFHFNWYGTIASIRIHFNMRHELHVNFIPTFATTTAAATGSQCCAFRISEAGPRWHPPLDRNCFRIKTNRMVKVDLCAIDSIYLTVD